MPHFRYRLATLLKLRERARDERKRQLAEALAAEAALDAREKQLDRQMQQIAQQVRRTAGRGTVDVDRIVQAQRYDAVLKAERQLLDRQRGLLQAELEKRRSALVDATQDVRVLEKLRDRQRARFEREQQRIEIREGDEIALRPYNRPEKGAG